MNDTPEIRQYIADTVRRAEKFLDVKQGIVFYDWDEFKKFLYSHGGINRFSLNRFSGIHWNDIKNENNIVYFNLPKFKTMKRLNISIVHEVLHYKVKRHSASFQLKVVDICNSLFDKERLYTTLDRFEGINRDV